MKRLLWLTAAIASLGVATAWSGSLQKGQMQYEHGLLEDAKRTLLDVVLGSAADSDKASALYLLGTIALEQKRYPIAAKAWSDLIQFYPQSDEAQVARTKIAKIPNGIQSSRVVVESKHSFSDSEPLDGVLVTGLSNEPKLADRMVTEITQMIRSKRVTVRGAQSASVSIPSFQKLASDAGVQSVLSLEMNFGLIESLKADCYAADGKLLWTEKTSRTFSMSKAGVADTLIDRIKDKIEPHVGDECLPKG